MCLLFAATYPERTVALVLIGTYARRWSRTATLRRRTGGVRGVPRARSRTGGASRRARGTARRASSTTRAFRDVVRDYLRMSASPGAAVALTRMNGEIDVRHVLPTIARADARRATAPATATSRRGRSLHRGAHPRREARRASGRRPPAVGRRPGRDPRRDRGVPDRRRAGAPRPTASWRRCSSPTSSARPSGGRARRPALARAARRAPRAVRRELERFRGARGRHGRRRLPRDVRRPGARDPLRLRDPRRACGRSASRSGRACTPASASSRTTTSRGIAVAHRRARVGASPAPGEVLVSSTVKDLVAGSGIEFERARRARAEGRPGRVAALCCGRCLRRTSSTPCAPRSGGGTARSSDIRADELAAQVLNGLVGSGRLRPGEIEDVQMGCVTQVGEQALNVGRGAVLVAGWPETVCATTVDRQCGSSLQTAFNAASAIRPATSTSSSRPASST